MRLAPLIVAAVMAGLGPVMAQQFDMPMLPGVGPMLEFCMPMVPNCGPMGSGSTGGGAATQAPTVTSVVPNNGGTAGGTTVIISGSQFIGLSGAAAVKFGATNAASYVVLSPTAIRAVTPAHAAGTIDVTVTNPIGTSPTSAADHFTFSTCSHGLKFNQACNSEYLPAMFH